MAQKVTASDVKKAQVKIELNGVEETLIPSPNAIINLSMRYGGIAPLMTAIGQLNVQAMADTVAAGLSLEGRDARDMPTTVVESGLLELLPKLSEFASILANGGRPLKTEKSEEEGSNRPL